MKTICIDPGHGGADPGCVYDGFIESRFNLAMAKQLEKMLKGSGWPINVVMTRHEDKRLRLLDRAQIAKANDADLVLSIHANSFPDPRERGALFFHWPHSEITQRLASALAQRWPYYLQSPRNDIIEVGPKYPGAKNVVAAYAAPCLLVECAYASNEEDRKFLLSASGQREMVSAMTGCVARFLSLLP